MTTETKRSPILYLYYILIVIVSVAVDQITKWYAVKYLTVVDTVPIIKDALHLTYVENTGAAFGIMKNSRWIFMTVSTAAIVIIAVVIYKYGRQYPFASICLSMILGGGIGNMIDRVVLGYVVDFIDFRLIDFAVFNGADSFVCVGAFLLICYLTADLIREYKAEKAAKEALANAAPGAVKTESKDEQ